MISDAKRRANAKYKKDKVTRQQIELYATDQDIIDHLAKQDKKQTYIKQLIRADMAKGEK